MPAAAVIPAPIAYIKVVAVKKLVVGFLLRVSHVCSQCVLVVCCILLGNVTALNCVVSVLRHFTLRKLECFKQAFALNTLAWNNRIGLWSHFVGL